MKEEHKTELKEAGFVSKEEMDETIKRYEDRISKLENTVTSQIEVGETREPVYLGHKTAAQFADLKRTGFRFIDKDSEYDHAKFMIEFAEYLKDPKGQGERGRAAAKALYERTQKAAMQEGTTTEGGYLVSPEYYEEMLALARLYSVGLQDCRVITTGVKDVYIPTEDGVSAVSVAWINEEGPVGQSEPTVGQVHLTMNKCGAYSMVSNELLADSWFDIGSYLTELMAEAIGQAVDEQVWNGSGSPFTGILGNCLAANKHSMGTGDTSFANVDDTDFGDCMAKLVKARRNGAKWYMHREVLAKVINLHASTGGDRLFGELAMAPSRTILGYPIEEVEVMPDITNDDATSTPFISFGNMKHYVIAKHASGLRVDIDPYGRFLNDQTRFRFLMRLAMGMGHSGGFAEIKTAAS